MSAVGGASPAGAPRPGRPAGRVAGARSHPGVYRAVLALGALVLLAVGVSRLWTDLLWFRQLGFGEVFTTRLVTGLVLFAVLFAVMAGVLGGNLLLAQRLRPGNRRSSSRMVDQAQRVLTAQRRLAVGLPALVAATMAGISGFLQRDTYLAWRHGTSFGTTDPWFGKDVSFYVFSYPWWRFLLGQALWVVGLSAFAVGVAHFLTGALRTFTVGTGPDGQPLLRRQDPALRGPAQAHLSVLMGVLMLLLAVRSWLDRYGYSVDNNWLFTGIGWTDLHTRVEAKNVMVAIYLVVALVFFVNAWLRRGSVAITALVLALVSGMLLQGIYPAVVQRFTVQPKGPAKELAYIDANIRATRTAFGIDNVQVTDDQKVTTTVSAGQLTADAEALPGIRLIDPSLIAPTFEQLQQVRGYYAFPDVLDVDHYALGGKQTDAVVAVREIDSSQVPDASWTNLHTVYTHGHGLVAAYGNRRQDNGEPSWITRDIPITGQIKQTEPRIYFGQRANTYAVVGAPAGSAPVELDTPGGGSKGAAETRNTYDGSGGVAIGNPLVRAMYAIRFHDLNLLLSTSRVNSASRILYDRTPRERVRAVAPWLTTDSDTYPAVVGGRVVWVVDGYTTSALYPDSNQVDLKATTTDSQLGSRQQQQVVNYVRNSVKAVVDAYDGSVKLYAWDESDPVLQTWQKAYPGLVLPKASIPTELKAHLRYPADLFKLQRQVLGRYHTTNPETWFQQSDLWEVPNDPVALPGQGSDQKEAPNYLSIKWPGDASPVFSLTSTMVPKGRENLGAYLAVNADATSKDYGRLRVLKLSDEQQVPGPGQTFNAMNTDETVASKLRPYLMQGSAQARFGNLLTIPVGGGLLYVSPVYTQQSTTSGGYLVLRFVVVRFGEHIGIGTTLQEALDNVFKGDAGASTGEGAQSSSSKPTSTPAPTGKAAAQAYLTQASKAFAQADAALRKGDLTTYQKQLATARELLVKAQKALG